MTFLSEVLAFLKSSLRRIIDKKCPVTNVKFGAFGSLKWKLNEFEMTVTLVTFKNIENLMVLVD